MTPSVPKKLPPEKYRQVVEELAGLISDPVKKLKLLNFAIADYKRFSSYRELKAVLDKIIQSKTDPQEIKHYKALKKKLHQSIFPFFHPSMLWVYKYRYAVIPMFLVFSVASWGVIFTSSNKPANLKKHGLPVEGETSSVSPEMPIHFPAKKDVDHTNSTVSLTKKTTLHALTQLSVQQEETPKTFPRYLDKVIWLVEKTKNSETYSNGLKIITNYTTENVPRRYYKYGKDTPVPPEPDKTTDKIAGILYHATESDIYDFKPEMSDSIKKYSKALIKYLGKKKAYHYIIDRFGRVYRLVQEDHAAFHGGNAIWADENWIYLNLNHAFIGISFEGRDFEIANNEKEKSRAKKVIPMEVTSINEAQITSGKELTDWLRVKYKIPQENCVPHCLVSINRHSMLIGHHLDLSRGFPFYHYGLSDKYREIIPALTEFGFTYDEYFVDIFEGDLWPGIGMSEKHLKIEAKKHGMSLIGYRKLLNKRFTKFFDWRLEQEELYSNRNSPQSSQKEDNIKDSELKMEKTEKI